MWGLLICRFCRTLFENPKILPCAHSVCEKCLEGVVLKKNCDLLKCPICDVLLKIPVTGVKSIPNNVFLSKILDILKRETNASNEGDACDACSVSVLRTLRCEDCGMMLCTKCLHAHHDSVVTPARHQNERAMIQNERITLAHETEIRYVRTVEDVNRIPTPNGTQKVSKNGISDHEVQSARNATAFARDHQVHMPLTCKHHPKEDLRFFCNSCAQLACQDCVIANHITHIFVSTSDAAPSSKAQLNTLINQTTIRVLYLSEALRDVKNTEQKLIRCVKDMRNTIRGSTEETMKLNSDGLTTLHGEITNFEAQDISKRDIQEKGDDLVNHNAVLMPQNNSHDTSESPTVNSQKGPLLNNLTTKSKKKFEALAKHRMKLEMRLGLFENHQKFTMNLILSGNDEEILMLENCVMESLGELCQNTPEVPIECPDDSFLQLTHRESQRTRLNEVKNCGDSRSEDLKIVTGEGCGSCSFATGEGLTNAVVGQDCSFTVTVKDEENKPCIEGRDSIVARIKTPNGGYFRAELIEHKVGKHKFRYRTYSAGPHVLRITLRGEEILGSPFEALSSGSTDYTCRGRLVTKFGRLGSGKGELSQPQGLAVDRLSRIFVADTGNHRIQVFDETGRFLFAFGRKGSEAGEFNEPADVTITRTGHVIVADKLNDRLQFFTPDGKFTREMHCGILQPTAITTDQYNNILTIDSDHSRVLVCTMSGERLRSITRGSSTSNRLENVQDVACNQTGETFIISRIPAQNAGVTMATKQSHASLIQVFDNNGAYIREFVTPSYTRVKPNFCRLVTDNDDRVLATGSGNKVQVFTRVGGHLTNITFTEKDCDQIDISGIALSPTEAVVVADTVNGRILVF